MANRNETFLSAVDEATKDAILESIAGRYMITSADAFTEIADDEAEDLLEYLVEPQRSATSVLMQRHALL